MKYSIYTLLVGLLALNVNAQGFFEDADTFFKKYTFKGFVDYAKIQENELELAQLVSQIKDFEPTKDNEKAFLINAYNVLVIQGIIENPGVASVMDIPNFFDAKDYEVAGKKLSLNMLEKEWLYKEYPDPTLHFALICGAKGCPPIASHAYFPDGLVRQLGKQSERALNDPNFIKVQDMDSKVELSKIFDWYSDDFGGKDNLIEFINRYREKFIPTSFKVDFYEYDWSLNGPQIVKKK